MNGLLEKLRRGAIRALGGYVEQVPPPKPQDRVLIKEERYRVRKIEVRAMPFDNGPRAEELLQRYKKYSSERLADMLAKKMLESGGNPHRGKTGGGKIRRQRAARDGLRRVSAGRQRG